MTSMTSRKTRSRNKPNIRDHMDIILESKGFYRKHVASEEGSLFRALSDGLFGTQHYRFILAKAVELAAKDDADESVLYELDPSFSLVRRLGQLFKFDFEIINSTDDRLIPFSFEIENDEIRRERLTIPRLLLCYTPPNQFDPIYRKKWIEHAGICQSILYELLYVDIFNVYDAMEAADVMLNGEFDPIEGKPEIIDPEFDGSALEALDNFLIPFPYKVAKCLDPQSYRNIEYDVWLVDRPNNHDSPTRSSSFHGGPRGFSIGSLPRGTPCAIRFQESGTFYGYVLGPTSSNKMMEVFLPLYEQCVYIDRSMVLPIQEMPPEMQILPRHPNERPRLSDSHPAQVQDAQRRNLFMVKAEDPNWLGKSDFSIPPPAFEDDEPNEDDECIPIPEPEFIPPPPLDLSAINNYNDYNDISESSDYCSLCSAQGGMQQPLHPPMPSPQPQFVLPWRPFSGICYLVSPVMSPLSPIFAAPPPTPILQFAASPLEQPPSQVFVFPDVNNNNNNNA